MQKTLIIRLTAEHLVARYGYSKDLIDEVNLIIIQEKAAVQPLGLDDLKKYFMTFAAVLHLYSSTAANLSQKPEYQGQDVSERTEAIRKAARTEIDESLHGLIEIEKSGDVLSASQKMIDYWNRISDKAVTIAESLVANFGQPIVEAVKVKINEIEEIPDKLTITISFLQDVNQIALLIIKILTVLEKAQDIFGEDDELDKNVEDVPNQCIDNYADLAIESINLINMIIQLAIKIKD